MEIQNFDNTIFVDVLFSSPPDQLSASPEDPSVLGVPLPYTVFVEVIQELRDGLFCGVTKLFNNNFSVCEEKLGTFFKKSCMRHVAIK